MASQTGFFGLFGRGRGERSFEVKSLEGVRPDRVRGYGALQRQLRTDSQVSELRG